MKHMCESKRLLISNRRSADCSFFTNWRQPLGMPAWLSVLAAFVVMMCVVSVVLL